MLPHKVILWSCHSSTSHLRQGSHLVAQVQNSDQLYQALKRLGVETELVVYPDQHHGITLPSFERDRYERWLQWFDKYTKA